MAVEAPVQRGPVIRAPEKRVRGLRKAVAVTAAATGLAVAGLLGYEAIQPKQQTPEPTPIAGGIGEPTPTPSSTIEITPLPSFEATPSPTFEVTPEPTPDMSKWWNQIPENPYKDKSVNEIPLSKDNFGYSREGYLKMVFVPFKPYYAVEVIGATIIAVEPDIKNNVAWVELATAKPGTKITRDKCQTAYVTSFNSINFCMYSGPTLWLIVSDKTFVYNGNASERYGNGLEVAAKYLKVGDVIKSDFELGVPPNSLLTQADINRNINSWNNLKNSVGKSIARTTKPNLNFAFNPGDIFVYNR